MENNVNIPQDEESIKNKNATTANQIPEAQQEQTQSAPTMSQIQSVLKQVREMLNFQESIWHQVQQEFKINSNHMRIIVDYNEANQVIPENFDENNPPEDYDFLNGLDNITDEKLTEIFGEETNIFGVDHTQTIDRVKWAAQTFINYLRSMFDFNHISQEYSNMIEENEKATIESMKDLMEKEEDPGKKAIIKKQVDDYYYFKNMEFLAAPVDESVANHIISTFTDQRKIQYIIERTKTALKRLNVSEKFILEIAQFEKLFLDEKYHPQSNLMLVYFMNLIVFNKIDVNCPARKKVISMVVNLDKYIKKQLSPEDSAIVLANILALEDQFLGKINQPEK
jgi:hypothetical protein